MKEKHITRGSDLKYLYVVQVDRIFNRNVYSCHYDEPLKGFSLHLN